MCVYGLAFDIRKGRAQSAQSVSIESSGLSGEEEVGTEHRNSGRLARLEVEYLNVERWLPTP